MNPKASRRSVAALLVALAACLSGCAADPGGIVSLEAEAGLMPRLEAILAASPLPQGWELAGAVGNSEAAPPRAVALALTASPLGAALPRGAEACGSLYLAASADIGENLYSVSAGQAEALGLSPLEDIALPRRALAVNGVWPGKPGYPFARRLALSARSLDGRSSPPRSLAKWMLEAAAEASMGDPYPVELAAAGDIQVGEYQWPLIVDGERGLVALLRDGVMGFLRAPDIAIANMEAPISARGYPNPRKRYLFRMPPGSAESLKEAGFDLLLFGNNHCFDFGADAFDDTLADLEKARLPMVGAGRDLAAAAAARFIVAGRRERLAFVGFAFYPNERLGFTSAEAAAGPDRAGACTDEASAIASVRSAADSGATVVVLAHGGSEYVEAPSSAARGLYARFVAAGAALVAGSHPHLLQGCEAKSGSLIAYSLGNFLFTGEAEPAAALNGAVLDFLVYRGRVRGLMIHPIVVGYYFTAVDPDQAGAEARFSRLCAELREPSLQGETDARDGAPTPEP